jgi:hypothetical protein
MKNRGNFVIGFSNIIVILFVITMSLDKGLDAILCFLIAFNAITSILNFYFVFRKGEN